MSRHEKVNWVVAGLLIVLLIGIRISIPKKTVAASVGEPIEAAQSEESRKILLNKASAEDLTRIPGIGEKLADAIFLYRTENGMFQSFEELLLVPGVGEAKIEEIKEYYRKKGY